MRWPIIARAALFMQAKTPQEFKDGYDEFKDSQAIGQGQDDSESVRVGRFDVRPARKENRSANAFERAVRRRQGQSQYDWPAYAQWLIKTGSVDKAEAALAEARKANPSSLDMLILSGVAARMAKKMKPAEDYFVQALRLSPSNGAVINQLALLLVEQAGQGKQERALQFALINAKLNAQSAEAQITLAWVLYQLGRLAKPTQRYATESGWAWQPEPGQQLPRRQDAGRSESSRHGQADSHAAHSRTTARESSSTGRTPRRCWKRSTRISRRIDSA